MPGRGLESYRLGTGFAFLLVCDSSEYAQPFLVLSRKPNIRLTPITKLSSFVLCRGEDSSLTDSVQVSHSS
ncbi:MAG: hypothetical protein WCO48_01815, partial [Candidatus Taylorbacteria bacterium]